MGRGLSGGTRGDALSLRADTVVQGDSGPGIYLTEMPRCCLGAFKRAVAAPGDDGPGGVVCGECRGEWRVVSSLDKLVAARFPVAVEEPEMKQKKAPKRRMG
ncbi:hypothetical protein [Rubrobacter indicoceani]|uniref:hypothetical protein n=1 Tax=Rubrobacter indicoceani TaxID=2051957 RepID=UPI000E5A11E4|nr:hypothetical protein [Rubrobacter indicoceani]